MIVCVLIIFALLDSAWEDGSFRVMQQNLVRLTNKEEQQSNSNARSTLFPYYDQAVRVESGSAFEQETSLYLERMLTIHDDNGDEGSKSKESGTGDKKKKPKKE